MEIKKFSAVPAHSVKHGGGKGEIQHTHGEIVGEIAIFGNIWHPWTNANPPKTSKNTFFDFLFLTLFNLQSAVWPLGQGAVLKGLSLTKKKHRPPCVDAEISGKTNFRGGGQF